VTPPDLTIVANADGIFNIVTMLLDNAVKFTPDGGAIGVTATLADGIVRLVVWDNGIGMSAEQQQSLFEPFTQADQGLARRFTGTGIGLAYVHKMASLLRGQVFVESEPGQGSRFTVTLPASE
jgi:signal transduction histidine kinase